MIKIIPYQNTHQNGIDEMMCTIALEFGDNTFAKPKKRTPIAPDIYWVAVNENEIIGTVGLISIDNDFAILKKMMLKKEYRGKSLGISKKY